MTDKDCILWAICFLAASCLIRITNPLLDYVFGVSVVLLWLLIMGMFPLFLIVFAISAGWVIADYFEHEDDGSTRWTLIASAAVTVILTLLSGIVRLFGTYISKLYLWTPDVEGLATSMSGVSSALLTSFVMCAIICTVIALFVQRTQDSLFGVEPARSQRAESEAPDVEAPTPSSTQKSEEPVESRK